MEKRNYEKGELNGPATISWPRYDHHDDHDDHDKGVDYCNSVLLDDHAGGGVLDDGDVFGMNIFMMFSIMRVRKAKRKRKDNVCFSGDSFEFNYSNGKMEVYVLTLNVCTALTV